MADQTLPTNDGAVDMSFQTESDLSGLQYHFVKLDSAELVVAATGNDKTAGILQNAPDGSSIAATAKIRLGGVSRLKISETIAFGQFLTPTSESEGEVCDAANEEFGARALSSGEDHDLILVKICHGEVTATDA